MVPIHMLRAVAVMGPRSGIATIASRSTIMPIASTSPILPATENKKHMKQQI
jgi:hypothetical protein